MRHIVDHKGITPANDALFITATDDPGLGGAYHKYEITGFDTSGNSSKTGENGYAHSYSRMVVLFQNGPVPEVGNNGVTEQALLAVVIDRLRSFQSGPYPCRENALALTKLEEAMHWMHARTLERTRRGVQGSMNR